jgi:hypothetical protein
VLNFYNVEFLTRLNDSLLKELQFVKSTEVKVLPQLLASCSHLKWRNEDLLNKVVNRWMFLQNISKGISDPEVLNEALTIFTALTYLNAAAPIASFLKRPMIAETVRSAYYASNPVTWLNIVTNFALQNEMTADIADLTLEPSFVKQLTGNIIVKLMFYHH